ncbi:hypothetical protein RF11_15994 [Thelohanellus kitauei]|uniref:Uncharacterized protein n=1 Tax=Thelohanellus kitauei TaxID=669202 RepID=A0A0C2MQA9_THEKT|nr:hypothetical protein RF11_15994 [Thelohanellus kitauei]
MRTKYSLRQLDEEIHFSLMAFVTFLCLHSRGCAICENDTLAYVYQPRGTKLFEYHKNPKMNCSRNDSLENDLKPTETNAKELSHIRQTLAGGYGGLIREPETRLC